MNESILVVSNVFNVDGISSIKNINMVLPINNVTSSNLLIGYIIDCCKDCLIAGASVTILNLNNNIVFASTKSNKSGEYYIANIPDGLYRILVQKEGYVSYHKYLKINDNVINRKNVGLYKKTL